MYKLIITSEYEVSENELNRIYDLLEQTEQRVFLVQDILGLYHIYDRNFVIRMDWDKATREYNSTRPDTLPEQERM